MSDPAFPYAVWSAGTLQNDIPANDNSLRTEMLIAAALAIESTQPVSPTDGDCYIIGAAPSGAQWSSFSQHDIALYRGGTWYAIAPPDGLLKYVEDDLTVYIFTGVWGAFSGGGGGGVPDQLVNAQTGTSYTYLTGDKSKLVTHTNAASIAGTLPQAGGSFPSGWWMDVQNRGAGTLTITPTTSTIDGASSLVLTTGNGVRIASDGTNYFTQRGMSSGGGLTNITEALSTASPNATTNVASLTVTGGSTIADLALSPKANGALSAHVANSSTTGGNKRGSYATDWQRDRTAATQVASGASSTIAGGRRNTTSATDTTIAGGFGNVASAQASTVAGGDSNTASGTYSTAVGGSGNTASGSYSVAGGQQCTASATHAVALGYATTASGIYSVAIGRGANCRSVLGAFAHSSGLISGVSGSQSGRYHLIKQTTDATPTALTAGAGTLDATTTVALPNASAYFFSIGVVARVSGGATVAGWKIEGTIKREGGAGTTALVGTPVVTAMGAIGGSLSVAAVADTTNGSLNVEVTGIAATTIRWSAIVDTAEVIY